ncbi:MAG: hypothetical protein KBS76_05060 [Ruminococcus sp.]|nr:hypothetical protein [Candidatus Apopatosoma intestinale]
MKEKNTVWYVKLCTVFLAVLLAINAVLAAVLIPVALGVAKDAKEALASVQNVENAITDTAEEANRTLRSLDEAIGELDLDTLNSALAEINQTMGVLSDAAKALEKVAR